MALLVSNRSFRMLFSASALSNLGDGLAALALPWVASLISRDPLHLALVAAAVRMPWFLFSIPAGIITDRLDRRVLILRADLLRCLLTIAVIGLVMNHAEMAAEGAQLYGIASLCGLAFLLGCAEVLRDNAAQTVLPSVVDKGDLEQANGTLWTIENIMGSFVGPPLAGVLIAYAVPAPFAVQAACFGVAALCVWGMVVPARAAVVQQNWRRDLRQAIAWFWAHGTILRLAIMLGTINALAMMTLTMLVLFSQEILGLSAVGHGILLTAGAIGGVVGGVLGPRVIARVGAMRAVYAALWLFPVPMFVIGLTAQPWVAALALFVESIAALLWNIVTVSWRQRMIPDELLGRVNSLYRFFGWGMMPLGALLGGWVVSWAEPELGREMALRLPYMLGGCGAICLAIYGSYRLRLS